MKRFIITGVILSFVAAALIGAVDAFAQGAVQSGIEAAQGDGVPTNLFGDVGIVSLVTNFMLFIVGALSVIMIIFGGIRYAISGGNSSAVTAAKNTIMYAIIGLIIAFLAFAIINWVLAVIAPGAGGAGFTNV